MPIKTITKDNFTAEVVKSDRPVLVEFWAPWCPYCRRLSPVLDRLSQKLGDDIPVGTVNVDEQPELEETFDVDTVPTLFLFRKGAQGDRLVAPPSQAKIEDWLKSQTEA